MILLKATGTEIFPCKFPVSQGNWWLGTANLAPTASKQGRVFRQ